MKRNFLSSVSASALMLCALCTNAQYSVKNDKYSFKSGDLIGLDYKRSLEVIGQKNNTITKLQKNNRYGGGPFVIIEDSVHYSMYNGTTSQLELEDKAVDIVYNCNHQKISEVILHYGVNNTWDNSGKEEYAYDLNGNLSQRIDYSWDSDNNVWRPYFRLTLSYDSNNNLSVQVGESYSGSGWTNFLRETFTYDSNYNETLQLTEYWQNGAWQIQYQLVRTFNVSNQLTEDLYQQSYDDGLSWRNQLRRTYSYDENNDNYLTFEENAVGNCCWESSLKIKNNYEDHLLVKEKYMYWTGTDWEIYYTNKYNYGAANTLKDLKMIMGSNTYASTRWHYYFHKLSLSKPENDNTTTGINTSASLPAQVDIYPNPSSGTFTVRLNDNHAIKNIEVYNALGEKIIEQNYPEVNISSSVKGLYYLKIYNGEQVYQQKILIE